MIDDNKLRKYFAYKHLPEKYQEISRPFHDLANHLELINTSLPPSSEKDMMFRKLLEAKDCAVRAALEVG